MSEIEINSKNSLSSKIENLVSTVKSDSADITSSASSIGSVTDYDEISLSSGSNTIISNFSNIFMDFSNVAETASNYIANLMLLDVNDFSATSSVGQSSSTVQSSSTGKSSGVEKASDANAVTYTAGEVLPGGMNIPLYYQQDYDDVWLSDNCTVAEAGCGYTTMSGVVSGMLGKTITPKEFVDDWSKQYFSDESGMSNSLPEATAEHYNLGKVVRTDDIDAVVEALENNHPVVAGQYQGIFDQYDCGHIIALRGITDDGKILVNDPNINNAELNNSSFTPEQINRNAGWYWIFEGNE